MEFQELVVVLAEETKYTKREIRSILRTFTRVIRETLADGRDVHIWGLGKFKNRKAAERAGRNPNTGELVRIPATRRIRFEPQKELKNSVKASAKLFETESLAARYGLPKKGKARGKVRSGD